MNIIKLNAIDSTNSYIKKNAIKNNFESYTVVVAEKQLNGRGQMGTIWESELGKNLTFSILINFNKFNITQQFYLSMAISLGVIAVLKQLFNSSFFIKWPNDILAEKDKVAGILIENSINSNFINPSFHLRFTAEMINFLQKSKKYILSYLLCIRFILRVLQGKIVNQIFVLVIYG